MEIRSVTNEKQTNYPKINEVSERKIKSNILKKWEKLGITSFMIGMVMRNRVLATSILESINNVPIQGAMPVYKTNYLLLNTGVIGLILSVLTFITTGITLLYGMSKKLKAKKLVKILFFVSIILSVVCLIIINKYR